MIFDQHEISSFKCRIDASGGIDLSCGYSHEEEHHHEHDPHIWLSPANAIQMAGNICNGLIEAYPEHKATFEANLSSLISELESLDAYAKTTLQGLNNRNIITFHDGFGYMASAFDLTIVHAIEEESGREASAAELIELINIVHEHHLSAIFTEYNGSTSAADIIRSETGVKIYTLDMCISGDDYFKAMYHNIDTLKEALG